jgi:hypothetical protein
MTPEVPVMSAIRIRKTIDSDTLTLPELRPLIGRTVEIVIEEQPAAAVSPGVIPGTGDWDALLAAAQGLEDYDYEAYIHQREYDRRHAGDHLP